jgi:hypothetical protein
MARRQGPQLLSLIYAKAFEADDLMRPEAATPHQGQGHERSRNRPDRFVHPKPPIPKDHLAREAFSNRVSFVNGFFCRRPGSRFSPRSE